MNTFDVIVIGGGIVGASAAYHAARGRARTLLIDSRTPGRATDAGAGIIAPETSGTGIDPVWFPLALQAGVYYPALIAELDAQGAGATGYQVCGELIVAADEDELAAYEQKTRVIFQRQQARGLPTVDDLREIAPIEARELFPPLKTVLKALYFRGGARVDGRMLASALQTAGLQHGLTYQQAHVERLLIERGRVIGIRTQDADLHAGRVILAGGAWSAAFAEQLGCAIPVEPQRGQIAHLHLAQAETGAWPIVEAFHGHYLVCWSEGRVVAGATRETDAGFAVQTTAAGVHEVLGEALRVAPGLSSAALREMRVGLRPRTADHLPVLGNVPQIEGIYLATGHGANGLQLGPFSGRLAAEWALGIDSGVDITPFHITRWSAQPDR